VRTLDTLGARILIVDDDPQIVAFLEHMLRTEGYTAVQSTTDSRDASTLYQNFRPDLILLDLSMPLVDGFEVMAQLRTIVQDDYLSVLVLTASANRDIRLQALESGAKDFLTKPVDRLEALTRIKNLVEVRLLHIEALSQNHELEAMVTARTAELRTAVDELNASRLEVILRMGWLAESRDQDTAEHISRVTHSCACLGRAIGMDERHCELLMNASAMHDVGKVGIPDRILRKQGRLEPEEMEIMKTHTRIGANVLRGSTHELMQMAAEIALTHHEKWDGTGYPNGISGEAIPLVGRIVAVCDVFDALMSKRPYKAAWTTDSAIAEIERCSGAQFDAHLVQAFLGVMPEILTIPGYATNSSFAGQVS
jgi:putative two-component system response regulator